MVVKKHGVIIETPTEAALVWGGGQGVRLARPEGAAESFGRR